MKKSKKTIKPGKSAAYICNVKDCGATLQNRMSRKRHMDNNHPNFETTPAISSNFENTEDGYMCKNVNM